MGIREGMEDGGFDTITRSRRERIREGGRRGVEGRGIEKGRKRREEK